MEGPINFQTDQSSWSATQGGGLNAPSQIGPPPSQFFPGPNTTFATPTGPTNQYAERLTVIAELKINALTDDSQLQYKEGLPLFGFRDEEDVDNDSITAYGICNLNELLERSFIQRVLQQRGQTINGTNELVVTKGGITKRKQSIQKDLLDRMPITIREFLDSYTFLGIFNTAGNRSRVRKRDITLGVGGEMKMANIFGAAVRPGDTVYLYVKSYKNTSPAYLNWKGRSIGAPTPGKFLQIRGAFEPHTNNPIHAGRVEQIVTSEGKIKTVKQDYPIEKDLDFIESSIIMQKIYEYDDVTQTIDMSKPTNDVETKIAVDLYQQGYAIQLGKVVRRGKDPTEEDIKTALRSFDYYTNLMSYAQIGHHAPL